MKPEFKKAMKKVHPVEQAIADGRDIAVVVGSTIWNFSKCRSGWIRMPIELSSAEAIDKEIQNLVDSGTLVCKPTAEDAVEGLAGLDNVLHPEISPVKRGFILCDGEQEPAIGVCDHVLLGAAPAKDYRVPVPYRGEYGRAICAECEEKRLAGKLDLNNVQLSCYDCYLRVKVTTHSWYVDFNEGEYANITRESDGYEAHVHRPADMSVADFKELYPVGEFVSTTELSKAPKTPEPEVDLKAMIDAQISA